MPISEVSVSTNSGLDRRISTLAQYFEQTCARRPADLAVVCESVKLSYAELDHEANRLAHLLRARGVTQDGPVGIMLAHSLHTYIALLAVLKAGAAYVPLAPTLPASRLAFIAADAGMCDLVTTSATRQRTAGLACPVLELDTAQAALGSQPASRPHIDIDPSSRCYLSYAADRGISFSHKDILTFLRVTRPTCGVKRADRVYQGLPLSVEFHLQQLWQCWAAGATLVAAPADAQDTGQALADFLVEQEVTVFCSAPTQLRTIQHAPASVRCLLVSGAPLPADLVRRWSGPGRHILTCYGPSTASSWARSRG